MDTASQVFGNIWLSLWSDDVTLENPPESWYRVAVYGVTGLATGENVDLDITDFHLSRL